MFENANLVFSYSRKQAIEDGVLVDLMQDETASLVKEAGFKYPIAMTSTAFAKTISPIDGGELPSGQSISGRLWDVLTVLRFAIRSAPKNEDRVYFPVSVWNGHSSDEVNMWAHFGPGDTPEPVITIMLEGED
jgi:hypothetical protein